MAKKLYLFGIGGTGSRVIKSLMMLFASGCKLENDFETVIPIIIDPDTGNGDLNRTKDILKLYQEIRNQIISDDSVDFFSQEIKTVNELSNKSSVVSPDYFQFNLNNVDQNTFGDYIGFNSLSEDYNNSKDDKNFTRMLFSERNLNSNLNVGFKGNPNMGAIVLNQFTKSKDFIKFGQSFADGDAVFIINSIFGGTGAAGFPLLLKTLRGENMPNYAKIQNAPIAALTFLPYFALNKKGAVNSDSFEDKAKIAIDYYNRTIITTNKINTIYFIGNRGNTKFLDYAVGGKEQKNNANFLELAGALAVFDFCKNINSNIPNNTHVKEFGIENDANPITFSDLNLNNQEKIVNPLTKYKLFTNYLSFGLPKALNVSRWTKSDIKMAKKVENSPLNEEYFNSAEYKIQIEAFNRHFDTWLNEMEDNKPAFSPFKKVKWDNALNILRDKSFGNKSYKPIDIENNKLITKLDLNAGTHKKHHALIKLFGKSTENVLNKYNILK
jgi:hypothetical protein